MLKSPKTRAAALARYWDVIAALVVASRSSLSLSEGMIRSAIELHAPAHQRGDEAVRTFDAMLNADLIRRMPRTQNYEIHPETHTYVASGTLEHELGLSAVLKVRVEAIQSRSAGLAEAIEVGNLDRLKENAKALSDLFRDIRTQMDQDRHAILEIAETAKAENVDVPITERYRRVMEAHDSYIAPMVELMDQSADGLFSQHLSRAAEVLQTAMDHIETRGGMIGLRDDLRNILIQSAELRQFSREAMTQCADAIFPLRERMRLNDTLTAAVAVRKRGLRRALPRDLLPAWHPEPGMLVEIGSEVRVIMAEARSWTPPDTILPSAAEVAASEPDRIIPTPESLLPSIRAAAPIDDLLEWLAGHQPGLTSDEILTLHDDIIDRLGSEALPDRGRRAVRMTDAQIRYHPQAFAKT